MITKLRSYKTPSFCPIFTHFVDKKFSSTPGMVHHERTSHHEILFLLNKMMNMKLRLRVKFKISHWKKLLTSVVNTSISVRKHSKVCRHILWSYNETISSSFLFSMEFFLYLIHLTNQFLCKKKVVKLLFNIIFTYQRIDVFFPYMFEYCCSKILLKKEICLFHDVIFNWYKIERKLSKGKYPNLEEKFQSITYMFPATWLSEKWKYSEIGSRFYFNTIKAKFSQI